MLLIGAGGPRGERASMSWNSTAAARVAGLGGVARRKWADGCSGYPVLGTDEDLPQLMRAKYPMR